MKAERSWHSPDEIILTMGLDEAKTLRDVLGQMHHPWGGTLSKINRCLIDAGISMDPYTIHFVDYAYKRRIIPRVEDGP